jgi:hypothetical protein
MLIVISIVATGTGLHVAADVIERNAKITTIAPAAEHCRT